MEKEKIAVLIPCYNEEITVGKVVQDFKRELPDADIYVYDNNSVDKTAEIAKANGAIVIPEFNQGKGNVVKSMFYDIDADYYIMVDGDDTYPAESVHKLLEPVKLGKADMCIGDRLSNGTYKKQNKRLFHDFGNSLVRTAINFLFHTKLKDIMTGYRVFNKKFVKNLPVLVPKFEIETEMTLYALDKKFKIKEIEIDYRDRPEGSVSKLDTLGDGIKVMTTIFRMLKDYRPLFFFGMISAVVFCASLFFGFPVLSQYFKIKFISKIPSAVLASCLMILAAIIFLFGMLVDTVVKINKENFQLNLLRYKQIEDHEKNAKKSQ